MADTHPLAVRLGRIALPDPRDAAYPLRAITRDIAVPNSKQWRLASQLDQGQSPMCVGFSGRQWLTMSPVRYKEVEPDGPTCYHGAQQFDGIPGPHDGSDSHGLMKYFQQQGLVGPYHWAADVEEMTQFILTTGPVLCGSVWLNDMFTPDAKGFVHPSGAVAGGHEYVCSGYDHKKWVLTFDNSWSSSWNPILKGRFKMDRTEFEHLIAQQGDMCAAVESSKT